MTAKRGPDLAESVAVANELSAWLRSLSTREALYAFKYSEHLSVGDPLPDAAGEGVTADSAKTIRARLDKEWRRRVWGKR